MTTENDLAKKLLDDFVKKKGFGGFYSWQSYIEKNPNGSATVENFAVFCARKIQDYKQDVFDLDETIVDSAAKQVRIETAKQIFEELEKYGWIKEYTISEPTSGYNFIKAKFLQEKKTE